MSGHIPQSDGARTSSQVTASRVGADERQKTGSTTGHQGQYPGKETMTKVVYTDGACSNNGTKNAVAGIGE
jgi:hypothetical protein